MLIMLSRVIFQRKRVETPQSTDENNAVESLFSEPESRSSPDVSLQTESLRSRPSTSASAQENPVRKKSAMHSQRRSLVKEMPTEFTESAIGNATKAIIAQQHSTSAAQVQPLKLPKPKLSGLSFKKVPTAATAERTSLSESGAPGPSKNVPKPTVSITDATQIVQSPVSIGDDMHALDTPTSEIKYVDWIIATL